ncbi:MULTISPECIES: hypothetical protein [unclassified Rhizobium]|uniref:hypothetical protein n=1 Tax=unclassified Rhizobium TaxID=2613769 RepID=UPI00115D3EB5|nr:MULTISPECIES: hypothetical protein [unclassified Rhizobium]TQX90241.1 hypothetical protein EQW76_11095 [Rhizobium sp. rho-13.1]TQY16191.1 hypothetical protein EQW74_10685 [Rhizobium sp. rho-1.1]
MTEKEINDNALQIAVTRLVDRMQTDRIAHDLAIAQMMERLSIAGAAPIMGITIPHWTPYLTAEEFNTLVAWREGQNMLIHKLSN